MFINLQPYTRCEDTKQNKYFSFIFHNSRLQGLALYLVLLVINQCENDIFIYRFPHIIKKTLISSITRLITVSFDWTLAVCHCLINPTLCCSSVNLFQNIISIQPIRLLFCWGAFFLTLFSVYYSPSSIETLSCVKHPKEQNSLKFVPRQDSCWKFASKILSEKACLNFYRKTFQLMD